MLNLARLATMLIAVSATKGSSPLSEGLQHIGNACGVFGRIACLDMTLLDDLSELGEFMKTLMAVKMGEAQISRGKTYQV